MSRRGVCDIMSSLASVVTATYENLSLWATGTSSTIANSTEDGSNIAENAVAMEIWLLGRVYQLPKDEKSLADDWEARIWCTYRSGFPLLDVYTSDAGWGCMLRSGQMMLASALMLRCFGRDWRRSPERVTSARYLELLEWFGDAPDRPYSIHRIAAGGVRLDKEVGSWFGPSAMAQVAKALICEQQQGGEMCGALAAHVAMDGVVVRDEVRALAAQAGVPPSSDENGLLSNPPPADAWRPVLLFIPLRLGLAALNPIYLQILRKVFSLPQSIGFTGGRPNSAYYFIGLKSSGAADNYSGEDEVLYLDPHSVQAYVEDIREEGAEDSYCCRSTSSMPLRNIDPSLCLGFFLRDAEDFDALLSSFAAMEKESGAAPLFSVLDSAMHWGEFDLKGGSEDKRYVGKGKGGIGDCAGGGEDDDIGDDDDEFELL